jgi:hypothetical protein
MVTVYYIFDKTKLHKHYRSVIYAIRVPVSKSKAAQNQQTKSRAESPLHIQLLKRLLLTWQPRAHHQLTECLHLKTAKFSSSSLAPRGITLQAKCVTSVLGVQSYHFPF